MAVITISRKVGSLGEETAELVAKELGYRLVSRQEVHQMAQACDDDVKKACSIFETEISSGFFERFFLRDPSYRSLFSSLIYELASQDNVVILGRGSQIILTEEPGVFKVRVVAPSEVRIKRIAERNDIPINEAAEYVRRFDRQRRSLIESIFDCNLSDWSLYDLVVNTKNMDQQVAAGLIAHAVKQMDWPGQSSEWSQRFQRMALAKKIETAIKKRIPTEPHRNIEVTSVKEGQVIITGFVDDQQSLEQVEKIASEYPGVDGVDNQLRTTGLSFVGT
ncbi:MAG: cytidylate kinase family protein [Desulfarculaceae bacterium]|jgi:cytidylate kinase